VAVLAALALSLDRLGFGALFTSLAGSFWILCESSLLICHTTSFAYLIVRLQLCPKIIKPAVEFLIEPRWYTVSYQL
jgi:hypothetical protein